MANYYASCRSNYFKVKDEVQFRNWIEDFDVEVITDEVNGEVLLGFISTEEFGTIPYIEEDKDEGIMENRFLVEEISDYLKDGETVVIQEVGSEKMRFLNGYSIAIHSNGDFINLSLNEIYGMAMKKFGGNITECRW